MDKLDLILQKLEKLDKLETEVSQMSQEVRQINLTIETEIRPQLKALAEGQKTILETLSPKTEVEKLREEVEFLRDVIRLHSREIQELKKAQ